MLRSRCRLASSSGAASFILRSILCTSSRSTSGVSDIASRVESPQRLPGSEMPTQKCCVFPLQGDPLHLYIAKQAFTTINRKESMMLICLEDCESKRKGMSE
eukprot:GHVP01004346.1.p3 GENE.GHVP01004346.1~~GHVP01004346.1.p3  ORF type:complete len:102 (-),score=15.64 GHVP01004346.1:1621-1926(-)